jgi:hypothetical protein
MKIDKSKAVQFLVALGFAKAPEWPNEKLIERLDKIPSKVEDSEVPEGFEELYGKLLNLSTDDKIELVGGDATKEKKSASKKPAKKPAPEDKDEDEDEEPPADVDDDDDDEEPPADEDEDEEEDKGEKLAGKKKGKRKAERLELDAFGSRIGTVSAKVNAVLTDEWKDKKAIAKAAGVSIQQAHGRLYHASQDGVIEGRRSVVQYRLKQKED